MKITSRIPEIPNSSYFAMNRWFYKMYLAGFLYHPDEPAENIIQITTGKLIFTPEECVKLNKAIDLMFNHHGNKVYSCGIKYFHKALGITPDYTKM